MPLSNTISDKELGQGVVAVVAEDDAVVRRLVAKALEPFGFERISEAKDGVAARAILCVHPVDLVVTDLKMPRLDGLSLMEWARENCVGMAWIILSGVDDFDSALRAIQLGAFNYLPKPVQTTQLQVAVRNALLHRHLSKEKHRLHTQLEKTNLRLRQRVDQLEKLCGMLEEQSETIHEDLCRAEMIQRALLPNDPVGLPGFSVNAVFRPGYHVGGDLYDVVPLDDRYSVIYVADAAGHGVSAAMLSVLFKQRLRMNDNQSRPGRPANVLAAVNRKLLEDVTSPGLFLTAAYCLLDTHTREITIASAGHPPLLLARAEGATEHISRTGPALGLFADSAFEEVTLQLQKDDRLLLYTDGVLDGSSVSSLTPEHLEETVSHADTSGHEILRRSLEYALASRPDTEHDDITLLLLQAREGGCVFDNASPERVNVNVNVNVDGDGDGDVGPQTEQVPTTLLYGEGDDRTYFSIHGRGTWAYSDVFHAATGATLEAKRGLTLDLSGCDYLDSTFLGTIHEMVVKGAAGKQIVLQGVGKNLRHLFEELSMRQVLSSIREERLPLPKEMSPIGQFRSDSERQHLRVLRAHEILSSLSQHNREQFRSVVASLRKEIHDD